jgi:lipopolysaccharide assembly outer membrane protein LptD (OstA)
MNTSRIVSMLLLSALAVVVLAALVEAQGVAFGRVAGLPPDGGQTQFTARADYHVPGSATYRGNVVISFPDAKVVVNADEVTVVTVNDETKELTFSGNVRLRLDSK